MKIKICDISAKKYNKITVTHRKFLRIKIPVNFYLKFHLLHNFVK